VCLSFRPKDTGQDRKTGFQPGLQTKSADDFGEDDKHRVGLLHRKKYNNLCMFFIENQIMYLSC